MLSRLASQICLVYLELYLRSYLMPPESSKAYAKFIFWQQQKDVRFNKEAPTPWTTVAYFSSLVCIKFRTDFTRSIFFITLPIDTP